MTLVFDTETTGLADFKQPPEHPSQPRLVQLGAILYDDQWVVRGELNLIIKPEGFEIPVGASNVHGITTEIATQYGLAEQPVLKLFTGFMARASVLVAHNLAFDGIVMGRAYAVHSIETKLPEVKQCTMQTMTDVCKLPGRFPGKFKWPSLQEAHKHCFGKEFIGAHDAMADVRACADVYRWLKTN